MTEGRKCEHPSESVLPVEINDEWYIWCKVCDLTTGHYTSFDAAWRAWGDLINPWSRVPFGNQEWGWMLTVTSLSRLLQPIYGHINKDGRFIHESKGGDLQNVDPAHLNALWKRAEVTKPSMPEVLITIDGQRGSIRDITIQKEYAKSDSETLEEKT